MKHMKLLGFAAAVLAVLVGCGLPIFQGKASRSGVDVVLAFSIPDFENHITPDQDNAAKDLGGESSARLLDAGVRRLVVTISGSDMETRTGSVDVDYSSLSYPGNNLNRAVKVLDVPCGLDRRIEAKAFGSDGTTLLLSGARSVTVDQNSSNFSVMMLPVNFEEISVGASLVRSILPGQTKFFKAKGMGTEWRDTYLASLESQVDVDLYAVRDYYSWVSAWYQTGAVNEAVVFNNNDTRDDFIIVYRPSGSGPEAQFTVSLEKQVSRPIDLSRAAINPSTVAYATIEGKGGIELGPYTYNPAIDLGGSTFVFGGIPYGKVYVHPSGFASFWKTGFWYDWWYWGLANWWNGYWVGSPWYYGNYYWLGHYWFFGDGQTLPNELVALYRTPLFFINDGGNVSKILYKTETFEGADKTARTRLIIEYKKLYHRYDPSNPGANRWLSGQIIIEQNAYDPAYASTIKLRYDRANSLMDAIPGFIGLENNTGSITMEPSQAERTSNLGIPTVDYEFSAKLGGIDATAE